MTIQDDLRTLVASHAERWRHCEGAAEATLLRLAILRDIIRALHAQKSTCLATGRRDLVQELKRWETRLHELRSQFKLEGQADLVSLVEGSDPVRKRTRLLPEALFSSIEREKLERYDRQWELALAAEAAALGWRFWALEAWVEITLVEEWNNRLGEQLWPSGIVLFVESSPVQGPAVDAGGKESPLWRGRWIAVVHPRFKSPSEIALNLAQWPGTPPEPPSPPAWKLLFSPRVR